MSGGIAYVYDPAGNFKDMCNHSMVDLEPVVPFDLEPAEAQEHPRQRSVSVDDNGMGNPLRFDADRLRILVERHLLFTGSSQARALLEDWENALDRFVKVTPRDYRRALMDLAAEKVAARSAAQ